MALSFLFCILIPLFAFMAIYDYILFFSLYIYIYIYHTSISFNHFIQFFIRSFFLFSDSVSYKIAVVVNDMADVNIDAELVRRGAGEVAHEREELLSLTNGCICCTLREDLLRTLLQLATSRSVDYIVVEGSGIAEPLPVAETFTFVEPVTQRSLGQYARLDTLVTVVDGPAFLHDFNSKDLLATREMEAAPGDERTVSQLLADQVEFANVILLNKCDMMDEESKAQLQALLHRLNPLAALHCTTHGQLELGNILNTNLFSMDVAAQHPMWLQEAREGEHKPETLE